MQWRKVSYFLSRHVEFFGVSMFLAVVAAVIFKKNRQNQVAKISYDEAVAKSQHEPASLHPYIDPNLCAGCGACVKACPEGEILQLIDHHSVLVNASKCVGHGQCEASCPFGAITLVFGTKTRGMEIPRITSNYETNIPGLYIVGELGGMGLIRNAAKQGRFAMEHVKKTVGKISQKSDLDVLIVGAGPAGFAASLAAREAGLKYLCIEQNSFGGTIANFPRQKILMTKPVDFPILGEVKFPRHQSTKEELLGLWNSVRKQHKLRIKEDTKFESLKKDGDIFLVQTSGGEVNAKKVILAMGVRGTPRRLGLPNEDSAKVTYNLIEPDQYRGKNIAVVGGGNVAVEAAYMLSNPKYKNKVTLLVRDKSLNRCNAENEKMITDYQSKGLVKIWYESECKGIHSDHIEVMHGGEGKKLKNDYLFVMIGAEIPTKFLMGLGVKIDKKFGEPIKRA